MNTTSDQWFYLHENRISIVIILILRDVLFRLSKRPQPGNQLSFMLYKLVFLEYHSQFSPSPYSFASSSYSCKGLAKLANIACQTLLFVSVSLAMDNQRTLLFGREQCLASNVGQFRQALTLYNHTLRQRYRYIPMPYFPLCFIKN